MRRRSSGAGTSTGTWPSSSGPRRNSSRARVRRLARPARPEHDNLRAALQWSAGEAEEPVAGLRLATGLWRFWEIRGHPHEGRAWLERMLAAVGPDRPSLLVADALVGAGVLASMQGDDDAAIAFGERSLAIQRKLGDPTAIAYAINNLANAAVRKGDFARARSLYTECVTLARSTGDERGQGFALINLAGVAAQLGDEAGAKAGFEESIAIFERFGDLWGIAFAKDEFATVLAREGDASTAGSLHEMALETWRELGDQRGVARALVHLADVAEIEGNLAEARNRTRQSLAIRQGLGDCPGSPRRWRSWPGSWPRISRRRRPGSSAVPKRSARRSAPPFRRSPWPITGVGWRRSGSGSASRRTRMRSARGTRWPRSRSSRRCRPELEARA